MVVKNNESPLGDGNHVVESTPPEFNTNVKNNESPLGDGNEAI